MEKEPMINELYFQNTKTNFEFRVKGDTEFLTTLFTQAMKMLGNQSEMISYTDEIGVENKWSHTNLIEFIHQKKGYRKA
ncbi:hypothetical protein FACS189418_9110 [Clostridia bacterium]|nr:hypothetical protein FACS189418_9110 [Clostridia bacterium]